jgi:hypothetical protein
MSEPIQTIVTERRDGIQEDTAARTPGDTPNIVVQPMPWYRIVLIRAGRVYMQSLISFLTVAQVGAATGVLPLEFAMSLQSAALLAIGPAVMSILQNTAELLVRLDESHPQLRA